MGPPNSEQPTRVLRFPAGSPLGWLYRMTANGRWEDLGEVRGPLVIVGEGALRLQVDDTGPVDLAALDELQPHDLDGIDLLNAMVGDEDLGHIARLTGLRRLDLGQTEITDRGLCDPRGLSHLQELDLLNTQVGDEGLAYLQSLTNLVWLDLSYTEVTDRGLTYLAPLTRLRHLTLTGTAIGDAGLEQLAHLTNMEQLELSHTQVGDDGLAYLKRMSALEQLFLENTHVTDVGLEQLTRLPLLRYVDLDGTGVTQDGLAALARALPHCQIVYHNPQAEERAEMIEQSDDMGPHTALIVPDRDLAAFLSCLTLGTLTAKRTGLLPPTAGDVLGFPRVANLVRGKIPRRIVAAMTESEELAGLPRVEWEAAMDRLIEQIRSELAALDHPDYDFYWSEELKKEGS